MLSLPQGHSATERIMSMKNCNDTIGNRTRNLPACSTVPQPTAPLRTLSVYSSINIKFRAWDCETATGHGNSSALCVWLLYKLLDHDVWQLSRYSDYRLDDPGFESWQSQRFFSYPNCPDQPVSTQPPIQWVLRCFPGGSSWGMILTNHLHLARTVKMSGGRVRISNLTFHKLFSMFCGSTYECSFFCLYRVRTIKLKIFCPLLGYIKSCLSSLLSGVGRISRLLIDVSRGRRQWYYPSESQYHCMRGGSFLVPRCVISECMHSE
jgi:hypothetical protein